MKHKLTVKKISGLLLRASAFVLLALFAVQLLCTIIPSVLGYKVYAVFTPSMTPAIPVGSLVCVKPAAAAEIQVDDICTFQSNKDKSKRFTHRVVGIDTEAQTFVTRGDAGLQDDPVPVAFNRLVGKVQFAIPLAGIFTLLLQDTAVKIIVVLFMIFWIETEIELLRRRNLKTKEKIPDTNLP